MDGDRMERGLATLTPQQSKRLLAEAVAAHPNVKRALISATIIIGVGTTNAQVAMRLTGKRIEELKFCAGIVRGGELDVIPREERLPPLILRKGKEVQEDPLEVLRDFGPDDVMIKGANAVDPQGIAGVLLGSREGGTIGRSLGIIQARGSLLIVPVGLEKLIPSVSHAVKTLGQDRIALSTGMKVGMMPVIGAQVITEIEALERLSGVKATLVAAGGWGDSQGAVTISFSGSDAQVARAFHWINFIKGRRKERPSSFS